MWHILKLIHQGKHRTGAKSDVYECLILVGHPSPNSKEGEYSDGRKSGSVASLLTATMQHFRFSSHHYSPSFSSLLRSHLLLTGFAVRITPGKFFGIKKLLVHELQNILDKNQHFYKPGFCLVVALHYTEFIHQAITPPLKFQ